jgi:Ca-activated chloride channel family protein
VRALHFANPAAFALLLAVPLLAAVWRHGDRRRRSALAEWGRGPGAAAGNPWKRGLQFAACVALVFALARPATEGITAPPPGKPTGDLVFLLDVSRSMLADDVGTLRLYRARDWIRQLGARANGQRVALVAFAGTQAVQCPLTFDHAFFDQMVKETGPDTVVRGGTKLGDAIRFASAYVFDDVERDVKTMVVVTDGGDQESAPDAAAREAAQRGIRVITLGIGDPVRGALVPESMANRTPVVYQGRPVNTRLEEGTLRTIGEYVSAGTGPIDAEGVYRRLLAAQRPAKGPRDGGDTLWMACLAVAILLLAMDARVPERRLLQAAVLALAVLAMPVSSFAQRVDEWFAKGVKALEEKRYPDAVRYFSEAAMWSPGVPEIRFNLGKTLYEYRAYMESAGSFEMAVKEARDPQMKAKCRLGQGNALFRYAEESRMDRIKRYQAALEAYKEAEKLDPTLFDAEFNRQVTERRLREWRNRMPGAAPTNVLPPEADADKLLQDMTARQPAAAPPARKHRGVDRDW